MPFDKIKSFVASSDNAEFHKFAIRTTTFDEFSKGTKVDTFDFVILAFMKAASSDDLESKEDYYNYYSMVPLLHYAVASKENQGEEFASVKKYLKDKYDKRLFTSEPLEFKDLADTKACAESLVQHMEQLRSRKDEIFQGTIKKAFEKFDKDGSGTIDANELGQLSSDLGQPLNEDQLATALKDLDLNGDGVIDTEEFARWYFTGMKAYNGATRSMLQMRNQTSTIFDVLGKDDIQKLLKEDKSMTKHRIQIKFNDPNESYYGDFVFHMLGPFTEKLDAKCEAFCKEIKYKEEPGAKTAKIFATLYITMKPGNKIKYK